MPFFSVIVPAYNREHLLALALRSILAQRFGDYEVIVVDDGSTDGTARVAAELGRGIRLIRLERNRGFCTARNAGLAVAHGEYCALLDSDDYWAPWTLECYHRAITANRRPAIVSCDGIVGIRGEGDMSRLTETPFLATAFQDYLAYRCRHPQGLIAVIGMAIRTDLLRQVGGFREQFHAFSEDQDLWLRLGLASRFVRISQPLCWGYRDHSGNLSKDLPRQFQGGRVLIRSERQGDYPGGRQRRWDRRKVITLMTRYMAREALEKGHVADGLSLYGKTLAWNLRLGRIRFLAAYPVLAAAALAKSVLHVGSGTGAAAPAPAISRPLAHA